jgi:hypothetical protein
VIPQTPDADSLDLARRLLAHEAGDEHAPESPVLFRVSEKLRRPLSRLAGTIGFHSLLHRALTVASVKAPSLGVVRINPDGSLHGLDAIGDGDEAAEAGAILIGQLLALLVLFIGKSLVLSLVSDIWPDFVSVNGTSESR